MPSTESTGRSTTESGAAAVPSGIRITGNCQICAVEAAFVGQPPDHGIGLRRRSSRAGVSELAQTCMLGSGARVAMPPPRDSPRPAG